MRISIIVAVAENGVIGRQGQLPWRLSGDLQRFKRLTMGHTIVMGRRTWESIGRALPGRQTVVVSRNSEYRVRTAGVEQVGSLDDALRVAEAGGETEAFVVGGAELYREALGQADRIYLTRVHAAVGGDTYFPNVDWENWQLVESEEHGSDEKNEYAHGFEVYDRR
jgi:dihydrofolate reductase